MLRAVSFKSSKRNLISLFNTNKLSSAAPTTHGHHEVSHQTELHPRIGKREIVGYGVNGQPSYFDNAIVPLPSVRWSPADQNISQLREKAKGDWSKLTLDEKKALYRADFRQTFSEMVNQTHGEWKWTTGMILAFMGATLWVYTLVRSLIYDYPRLETSSDEHQARMLERMIGQGVGKVHGVSSQWDYEKGEWKKS